VGYQLYKQTIGLKGPVVSYRLSLGFNSGSAEDVRKAWASFVSERAISVTSYGETRKGQGEVVLDASFCLPEDHANDAASLGQKFARIPGVTQVNLAQIPIPD